MTSALHIYPSTFTHESRILKETRSLVDSGLFERIYIGAIWDDGLAEHEQLDSRRSVRRVPLKTRKLPGFLGKLLRFAEWYLRIFFEFRSKRPTFVNCHSLSVLPLGVMFKLFSGARLIYDAHELETETHTCTGLRKKLAKILELTLIGQVEAVIVVSELIGTWYRNTYNLHEVYVVKNVPYAKQSATKKTLLLREFCKLKNNDILFLYQGVIDEGRGVEIFLETFSQQKQGRHIVFLGNGSLAQTVIDYSKRYNNIHYHPAVKPNELVEYTASADVGILLTENVCLSHYYSLPNKIFEYLLAGLPVIMSDFPEMLKVLEDTNCGWKCSTDAISFKSLVESITDEKLIEYAEGSKKAALSYGWHNEELVLIALYEKLLGREAEKRTP